jgi:hypothetical protein
MHRVYPEKKNWVFFPFCFEVISLFVVQESRALDRMFEINI